MNQKQLLFSIILTISTAVLLTGCNNGHQYEGDLLNGMPHGSGTLTYNYGTTYSGTFKNGLRHGSGIWQHSSGISYNGEWNEDTYHNWGRLSIPDYIFYEGTWEQGRKEGYGTQQWPDGRRYIGEWQDGRRHGYGVMYYPEDSVYRGEWAYGRREGPGELTTPEGDILTGLWEKGQFVYVPIVAIALNQQKLALTEGQPPSPLTFTMLPFDATNQKVDWNSSEPSIATVDEEGLVTPLARGETEITVTAVAEELEASCLVTVNPSYIAVEGVSIDPPYLIIFLFGDKITINARVQPYNATNKNVRWQSDRPDVAAVNPATGLVTPVSEGLAYIRAETEDGGYTATCLVHIRLANPFLSDFDSPVN